MGGDVILKKSKTSKQTKLIQEKIQPLPWVSIDTLVADNDENDLLDEEQRAVKE